MYSLCFCTFVLDPVKLFTPICMYFSRKILSRERPCNHAHAAGFCLLRATLDTLKTVLLDAVSLDGETSGGRHLFPRWPLVSNLGGMGSGHLWGPFASFLLVKGDDGDLPGTNASHEPSFARITSAKRQRTAVLTPGTAHFELRQFGHLAANGSILETDTPRQAAVWRFWALNTVVELARARTPQSCMTHVMQSHA